MIQYINNIHRYTKIVVLLFIFSIPWRNSIVLVPGAATITKLIGIILVLFWIIKTVNKPHIQLRTFHLILLVYLIWNIFSIVWSYSVSGSLIKTIGILMNLGLAIILYNEGQTTGSYIQYIYAYVAGCWVVVIMIILNYIQGINHPGSPGRYSFGGASPNDVATIVLFGIPLTYILIKDTDFSWNLRSLVQYVTLPLFILSILLTGSRQNIVALVLPISYIILVNRKKVITKSGLVATSLLVLIMSTFVPDSLFRRLRTIPQLISNPEILRYRLETWGYIIEYVQQKPLLGYGTGVSSYILSQLPVIQDALDNVVLTIILETGVVGLCLYIFLFIVVIIPHIKNKNIIWISIFGIWMIVSVFNNWGTSVVTYYLLTMALLAQNREIFNERWEHPS